MVELTASIDVPAGSGMPDSAARSRAPLLMDCVGAAVAILGAETDDARRHAHQWWRTAEASVRTDESHEPLARLVRRLGVDSFSLRCLSAAFATHVDPALPAILDRHSGGAHTRSLTVRIVLDRFCATPEERLAARHAFLSSAPLIRHRLMVLGRGEPGGADVLPGRRLDVSAPMVRCLLGEDELSDAVSRFARLDRPQVSILQVILPEGPLRRVTQLALNYRRTRQALGSGGLDRPRRITAAWPC